MAARQPDRRPLPRWVDHYTTVGLYSLVVGTALALFALFTNPVPDPSFPWATLPASPRLPVRQPRIEHWPVTYTVGIWLWVGSFPALFFAGYRRRRWGVGATGRLVGLPAAAMLAWTTYCRGLWPKLQPPTWNAPSRTLVCWPYCSSYEPVWSTAAYAVATLGVAARRLRGDVAALAAFGILAFPLGLPALAAAWRRRETRRLAG